MDFQVTMSDGRQMVISLNTTGVEVGDILIFDGEVLHRGCAYTTTVVAAHIYLDVEGVKALRPMSAVRFGRCHYLGDGGGRVLTSDMSRETVETAFGCDVYDGSVIYSI